MIRRLIRLLILPLALAACAGLPERPAPVLELAPGVYMLPGRPGEVGPDNLGRTGNAGFIVGRDGVVAIDTGTSYRHGEALLAAIATVTDRPVRLALITTVHQEFLFGAAAYRARGIPVHMHERAAGLMAARCENCLRTLRRTLGEEAMRGTAMFRPDAVFAGSHEIDSSGRRLRVLHFGHSSGPGDIAVLDVESGVLFAGGLLDNERIPDVQDSVLDGWKRALLELRALRPALIVPGHGPAAPATLVDRVERYLTQLEKRLLDLLLAGTALSEVADAAVLPEFEQWDQAETIHRRNASIVFLRLERDHMLK